MIYPHIKFLLVYPTFIADLNPRCFGKWREVLQRLLPPAMPFALWILSDVSWPVLFFSVGMASRS